jgi:hypothetical protein
MTKIDQHTIINLDRKVALGGNNRLPPTKKLLLIRRWYKWSSLELCQREAIFSVLSLERIGYLIPLIQLVPNGRRKGCYLRGETMFYIVFLYSGFSRGCIAQIAFNGHFIKSNDHNTACALIKSNGIYLWMYWDYKVKWHIPIWVIDWLPFIAGKQKTQDDAEMKRRASRSLHADLLRNENLNLLVQIKSLNLFLHSSYKNWKIYRFEQSFTGPWPEERCSSWWLCRWHTVCGLCITIITCFYRWLH